MLDERKYREKFEKELLESCAPFWLRYAKDEECGGILNCVDRKGEVYSTDKSVWMQGRCGWTYSYIYRHIEGKKEYLDMAKHAIDFAAKHCIDEDGRMFFTVTRSGEPLRKRRYRFSEAFYAIAVICKSKSERKIFLSCLCYKTARKSRPKFGRLHIFYSITRL